jgi:hypothetical protein
MTEANHGVASRKIWLLSIPPVSINPLFRMNI